MTTTEPVPPAAGPRLKLVTWSLLISTLALGATLAAGRTVLLVEVDQQADATITQEVQAFIGFVEGSHHIGNGEEEQFASEAELMRSFLARQTPESHEALIAISDGEVMLLDNARHDAGLRFAESETAMDAVLSAEASSGALHTDGFGEVRWGRVTTDQDGAFLVLHFTTPAEADVQTTTATFARLGAGSLLLVAALAWLISRWTGTPPAQRSITAEAQGPSRSQPTPPPPDIHPQATTAARLLLGVQREAAVTHPQRRFLLATEPLQNPDVVEAALRSEASVVRVLGELAQIEAEVDTDAVHTGLLALVDHALGTESGRSTAPVDAAVVLTAGTVAAQQDPPSRLRLTVRSLTPQTPDPEPGATAAVPAGRATTTRLSHAAISSAEAARPSPSGASAYWELAEQVAAAHQGWCWRDSGSGPTMRIGMDLPLSASDETCTPAGLGADPGAM
ncbi:hypothetical protein [Nesterenkonia sp. HG001]|uniref:hypothetical protein n=1 Tax=Nesterenkonia sp. HG001 TaxID=2983207 RepID=UPI002AC5AD73|nr:hypothetical protein [Nesterenkonia sp. HG001]MDZ5077255.1 hypothetical protein [Nesterenkonia sp. HG001]